MTQEEIIVRYLAARTGEWVVSHALEKANLDGHWIGTRGSRTARDLAQHGKWTDEKGAIGEKGATYFVERRREGKYAEFRVTGTKMKPRVIYVEKLNDNGQVVRVPTTVC